MPRADEELDAAWECVGVAEDTVWRVPIVAVAPACFYLSSLWADADEGFALVALGLFGVGCYLVIYAVRGKRDG
jgi:hypothetical protein